MNAPATLNRAGIAARIPHQGSMCLLDELLAWDRDQLRVLSRSHGHAEHPLRGPLGLAAPVAIELASQAMALHGSLCAEAAGDGGEARPGFLASARQVRLRVPRLDDAPGPLEVSVRHQAGDGQQALYQFAVHDANGRLLVDGRAAVVLNRPLELPTPATT